MSRKKILFIDRDGTLIEEPPDEQVDSLEKLSLVAQVIPSLLLLRDAGYRFVMVTNQDGLGSDSFPREQFEAPHRAMMALFASQGITFDEVLICPHFAHDGCLCRKPHLGLVRPILQAGEMDPERSAVVGDRQSDVDLAANMGLRAFRLGADWDWPAIARELLGARRRASSSRRTSETQITVEVELDGSGKAEVATGIGFFDHMLEQLARHSGVDIVVKAEGDLHIDEHHTVEDTALVLGAAIRQALGDKVGIERFGFWLPMDETSARATIDLSGRPFSVWSGALSREQVGGLSTEMVPHFFRSLATALEATLHVEVTGENTHHMVEASFKAVARALGQALRKTREAGVPSTKGTL